MSVKTAKIYEPESVEDIALPESIGWDEIIGKPETLQEIDKNVGDLAYEDFVTDVLGSNLNTQTKKILGEFKFEGSGALAINTDANNGLWISPVGILGKKAGVTTFAIDNGGNATFSGSVTGATITGSTLQTASEGYRIKMAPGGSYQDSLMFMDGEYILSKMQVNVFPKGAGVYWTLSDSGEGFALVEDIYGVTAWMSDGLGFIEMKNGIVNISSGGACVMEVFEDIVEIVDGGLSVEGTIQSSTSMEMPKITFYSLGTDPATRTYGQMWHHYEGGGGPKNFRGTPWNSDVYTFDMTAV